MPPPGTRAAEGPRPAGEGFRHLATLAVPEASHAGLAVTGLRLPGRPGADQPAGAFPRLQPVAEVGAGEAFELPDVVLEVGQHGLALLPGQRLPLARVLLQEALQRPG